MATKRKQQAKKKENEEPQAQPVAARIRAFLFRPRVLLFVAAVASATVLLPMAKSLLPDLNKRPEFRLSTSEIQITVPPRWVPHDLVDQVATRAGLPDELSALDGDLTQQIAEAFQVHPWIAEVIRVRKSFPAKIDVELRYRRPVAMVQAKQGMYPIDGEGILLPPADFSVADTQRYLVIQNVSSTPQGPAGTNWGDVGVVGAGRLADILDEVNDSRSCWKKLGLAAICVPSRTKANVTIDELVYELVTDGGSRIVWGRAPGTDHPGELSAEQKLGRLEKYLAEFHTFEEPHGPYEIDIRHWQEISRRPLRASRERTLR